MLHSLSLPRTSIDVLSTLVETLNHMLLLLLLESLLLESLLLLVISFIYYTGICHHLQSRL